MPSTTEISCASLARLIGTPQAPLIFDLCIDEDFALDPRLIPGARRHSFQSIETLVPEIGARSCVLYCQKGLKLSQGAAAILRAQGIQAETLEGGQIAWAKAGLPMIQAAQVPAPYPFAATTWVTRARPKVDRVACAWLIRRFVDPQARFLFVSASQVEAVSEKFAATPFDIEGAKFSHVGASCTFDTMLAEFGLNSAPLLRMAAIVRGADTARPDLAPQAAGLLALSLGLSRMIRDDNAQIEAGLTFYDALYRWARDAVDETHEWPHASKGAKP